MSKRTKGPLTLRGPRWLSSGFLLQKIIDQPHDIRCVTAQNNSRCVCYPVKGKMYFLKILITDSVAEILCDFLFASSGNIENHAGLTSILLAIQKKIIYKQQSAAVWMRCME